MTFSRSFAAIAKLFAAERAFVYVTGRRQGVLDSVVAVIGANAIGIRNDIANFTYFDRKPVAMLVNGGTRSGKEILAYGFKKYRLGEIIGSRTEGAVLAATAFLIGGGLLLLAVEDVRVDGERLEGVGVAPTIEVQADPDSMDRSDPQLNRAIAVLSGA